jgi:hypothetical protein
MRPQRKDRQTGPTPEQMLAEIDAQAKEVLGHIYQAVLKTPEFTLKNGMKCRVSPLSEPEVDSDEELKCSFDVQTADGHLEFTVGHTGWGKSFVQAEAQKVKPKRPGRPR